MDSEGRFKLIFRRIDEMMSGDGQIALDELKTFLGIEATPDNKIVEADPTQA